MRSKTTKRILEETPQEIKDRVSEDVKFLLGRIDALSENNKEACEKIISEYFSAQKIDYQTFKLVFEETWGKQLREMDSILVSNSIWGKNEEL